MSFNANPDLYEYGTPPNVCPACFDAGKSPDSLFACFSGIEIGALWAPPLPAAPNGIYELLPINPCLWELNVGIWRIRLDLRFGVSVLEIWDSGFVWGFMKNTGVPCSPYFINNIVDPAREYYNGFGLAVPPLPGDDFSSDELLDLLGIDPRSDVWVNPRPMSAGAAVHSLSRGRDSTNIKVLYDHS